MSDALCVHIIIRFHAFIIDHCGTDKRQWSSHHDKAASQFSGKNTKHRHTDNGYDRHHNAKYTDRKVGFY